MDLSTRYLGLELPHPFIVGASPLADVLDDARRAEDAGAAAIVMRSLFEEQLRDEDRATHAALAPYEGSFPEALSFAPEPPSAIYGPAEYLERLRRTKEALAIPVFGSLNGVTPGGWIEFASAMEQAGADGIELNLFDVPTDPAVSSAELEARAALLVRSVKAATRVPVAVKLSPFYTSIAHFARELGLAGADGLVLFNRFYEPDVDIEELELGLRAELSRPQELLLRLRWLGILSPSWPGSLAVSGGVHGPEDAIKALMTGADVVQMVSTLMRGGLGQLGAIRGAVAAWLEEKGYASLAEMRGCMDITRCPDPAEYRRGNYMRVLRTWPANS